MQVHLFRRGLDGQGGLLLFLCLEMEGEMEEIEIKGMKEIKGMNEIEDIEMKEMKETKETKEVKGMNEMKGMKDARAARMPLPTFLAGVTVAVMTDVGIAGCSVAGVAFTGVASESVVSLGEGVTSQDFSIQVRIHQGCVDLN